VPSASSVAIAVAASAVIALLAWRAGALSRSGATAALFVGTVALSTGSAWGAYLVGWFVLTSALARVGRVRKARHVRGIVDKGGARDAWQVLANGGTFALLVLGTWFTGGEATVLVSVAAAASLAAAGADTWATEAGTWASGRAWSLRTRQWAPAGTSGAVTLPGTLAMAVGALCWSGAAMALGLVPAALWHAVASGGVAGATADTLLGALGQQRRWCERCQADTEQHRHDCGQATQHVGGVRWLDNDLVNLAATVIGAAVAALVAG
jgi:uncharacterized protein (TIGR00297 family)